MNEREGLSDSNKMQQLSKTVDGILQHGKSSSLEGRENSIPRRSGGRPQILKVKICATFEKQNDR